MLIGVVRRVGVDVIQQLCMYRFSSERQSTNKS